MRGPPPLVETRMPVPRMLRRGSRRELVYWRVRRCPRRTKTYGADRVGDRARHQRRVSLRERDESYAECRDQVPQLQIAMQVGETADLAREDQRLNVALKRIARRMAGRRRPAVARGSALLQTFGFHITQGLRDPLRSVRCARAEEDFGRRLRQHRLGIEPVALRQLRPPLEAKYERTIALAGLGHRRVQLREPLQARELVDDKPGSPAGRLRPVYQAG